MTGRQNAIDSEDASTHHSLDGVIPRQEDGHVRREDGRVRDVGSGRDAPIPLELANRLEPWHRQYAEWLSVQSKIPSKLEKQAKAFLFSGRRQTFLELRALETRPEFLDHLQAVAQDLTRQAKTIFQGAYRQFADDYLLMANKAKLAEDYDKWIKYGLPILDRVLPKQQEEHHRSVQVTVNFGTTGFASKQIEDAEFEVLVNGEPE